MSSTFVASGNDGSTGRIGESDPLPPTQTTTKKFDLNGCVDQCSNTSMNHQQRRSTINNTNGVNSRKRYSNNRNVIYMNIALIFVFFFALVQMFDPTIRYHINDDLHHHELNHSPIIQSLHEFSMGQQQQLTRQQTSTKLDAKMTPTIDSNSVANDRILQLLEEAGLSKDLSDRQKKQLPRWGQVVDLFGDSVVIVGKDDCMKYRTQVPLSQRQLGVAGMFNTGTNLLETQLRKNIKLPQESLWQVPWGKHRMATVKWNHTAEGMELYNKHNILPIVMIRDPFAWLQSMCKSPYAAEWRYRDHHCPNLVPNEADHKWFPNVHNAFSVTIKFDKQSHRHFDSLVHLWSEWYNEYLLVDYPILMIRYEDLVFQPATVLKEIADCVEGKLQEPIQYQLKTSKAHGSGTDYVKALAKTADAMARPNNMTIQDLDYAHLYLDQRLMQTFHYQFPSRDNINAQ